MNQINKTNENIRQEAFGSIIKNLHELEKQIKSIENEVVEARLTSREELTKDEWDAIRLIEEIAFHHTDNLVRTAKNSAIGLHNKVIGL